MADYGINIGKVFFVGLLSVIVTVDIVVGLEALYYWQVTQTEAAEDADPRPANLRALLEVQQKQLTDYRVLDGKKGIVSIPIDRAMDLTLAELSRQDAGVHRQGQSP
jgi:hypothetical protein